jgi:type IV pilus assembly protein PilB
MKRQLGTILLERNCISNQQLEEALIKQRSMIGVPLGRILVKMGYCDEPTILQALSIQYSIETINLDGNVDFDSLGKPFLDKINLDIARKYFIMPVRRRGALVTIAMANPGDMFALEDIRFISGLQIQPVVASETDIKNAWRKYYLGKGDDENKNQKKMEISSKDYEIGDDELNNASEMDTEDDMGVVDVDEFDQLISGAVEDMSVVDQMEEPPDDISGDDAPIVKLVNGILVRAIKSGASDIHIEPYEKSFYVRFRVDGVLHKVMSLPLKVKNAIVSRIKIMSKLNITERRLPQSGRIKLKISKKKSVDFRVEVLPCLFGERVVMRILSSSSIQDLSKIGFLPDDLEKFMKAINSPWGMILITGPTGSGKTTTLYSALTLLNTPEWNILTAEDPVEYNFQGISQVAINDKIGLTFASALRSFLRMDPDIIMVGEVRDGETAEICVKAALTGHLVLSTVHTNDAPSTIARLIDMGIKPYLLASALNIVVAQRLCRRICEGCKVEDKSKTPDELLSIGFRKEEIKDLKIYKGQGCPRCLGTGNIGRIGLYEVLSISEPLRREIAKDSSYDVIKKFSLQTGMHPLREVGLQKIRDGICCIDEVMSNTLAE